MALENRKLEVGTKLVARYKKEEHRAEVVAGEDDKTLIRLADGREFASVSAAGSAVMGGVACNGWRFWSLDGGEEEKPSKPKAKAKAKTKRAAKPKASENGKGPVACGDCGREFETSREAADHMRDEHNSAEAQAGEKA
jgi:hypothetical protein